MIKILSSQHGEMCLAESGEKLAIRFEHVYPRERFRRLLVRFRSEFPMAEYGETEAGVCWWVIPSSQRDTVIEFVHRNSLTLRNAV